MSTEHVVGPRDFAAVLALLRQHSPACKCTESERVARVEILTAPPEVILELAAAEDGRGAGRLEACATSGAVLSTQYSVLSTLGAWVRFNCPETGRSLGNPLVRTGAYWVFEDCVVPAPTLPEDALLRTLVCEASGDTIPISRTAGNRVMSPCQTYSGPQALELLYRARLAAREGVLAVRLDERLARLGEKVSAEALLLRMRTTVCFDEAGDLCIEPRYSTADGRTVPAASLAERQGAWVHFEGRFFRLPVGCGGEMSPDLSGEERVSRQVGTHSSLLTSHSFSPAHSASSAVNARKLTGDAIADFLLEELPGLRAAGAEITAEVEAAKVCRGLRPALEVGPAALDASAVRAQWFFETTEGHGGRVEPVEVIAAAARGQRYLRQGNVFIRAEREAVTAARERLALLQRGQTANFQTAGNFSPCQSPLREENIPELLSWARKAAADVQTPWNVYVAEAVTGAHQVKDDLATLRLRLDIAEDSEGNWFAFDADFDCGGESLSEEELRRLVSRGRKWFRKDNKWFKVDPAALRKFDQQVRKSGAVRCISRAGRPCYRFRPAERERVTNLFSLAGTAVHSERYRRFLEQLRGFERIEAQPLPAGWKPALQLRPYQQQGFEWLAFLARYGLNGILADDMGLGKTAQALAMLSGMKAQRGPAPSLIVAPTSLLDNWRAEAAKFNPDLRVLAYRGPAPQRDRLRAFAHEYDLVLGTYATVRNDVSLLRGIEWRYVILDEAHFIKNSAAATTKALKTIPAQHRLALTGTPVQNRLLELWSLFDFLMPGFLGRQKDFRERWEEPIGKLQARRGQTANFQTAGQSWPPAGWGCQSPPDEEESEGEQSLEELRQRIRPFVLRRLKSDVASELPPKIENDIFCPLSPEQAALYRGFAESAEARSAVKELAEKGAERARAAILAALMSLRKICNHADLLCLPKNAGRQHIARPLPGFERRAGKFEAFGELLQQCREGGHRALIFSQLTTMLDLLGHYLDLRGVTWLRLDGETPAAERQGLVQRFNADRAVDAFLISTRAGGTGLNLTGADTVIFYDHDWNPANDQQAQDRAHRIGQERTVNVYRLICKGTLEEKILRRQELKRKLAACIVPEGYGSLGDLSREELVGLFSLPEEGTDK